MVRTAESHAGIDLKFVCGENGKFPERGKQKTNGFFIKTDPIKTS
ncbi:hypothetical protein [Sporosarcina sp. NPDC096371]